MRAVCFWVIIAALSAVLLFLIFPVVLVIVAALDLAFDNGLLGGPFWLINVALCGLPLAAVAVIFAGMFRSLRGRG